MECSGDDEGTTPATSSKIQHSSSFKSDVDEAQSVAESFCQHYYHILGKKPHLIGQLYLENSVMQWDGNAVVTREGIQKFVETLPSLTFFVTSMDCQSVNRVAVGSKKAFIIKVAGQVRVSGIGVVKPFTQQIIVTAESDKWKIAADDFRSQ